MKTPRYSVSRKKNKTIYNCLYCNKEFGPTNASKNKFCSSACSNTYIWETSTVPNIEKGILGSRSVNSFKKYLRQTIGDKCNSCGILPFWNGKILVLQLDHIDGNSDNNLPGKIQLLCPNCHTQTSTFGNGGKGSRYKKITKRNSWLREYKKPR